MKTRKTRAAFAAAMLVGVSVLAGCGSDKDTAEDAAPPAAAPSVTPTPSASPSGRATPSAAQANFLAAADWPKGDRYGPWKQTASGKGLPDPEYFCIEGVLPKDQSEYRTFNADLDPEGRQMIVRTASAQDAEKLVDELNTSVAGCVERYDKEHPNDEITGKEYGELDLGDGVTLTGRFFAPKDSEYTLQLFAVGRAGSTVTVVMLGQMGQENEAPVDAFKATVTAAMGKLG